ncbi:MAG: Rieske 2Fe-2S domain-containing protein [Melioribacteraceae bacterium]
MKEPNGFSKVCKYSDLKEKLGKRFIVDDVDVALFKVDGKVYALSNMCIHQKAAIIYDGFIEDGKVSCPAHGWQFDLATGRVPNAVKGLDPYEVKIIDDDVYVKVYPKRMRW